MRVIKTSETPTGPEIRTGIIYSHIIGYVLRETEKRSPDQAVRDQAAALLKKNGAKDGGFPRETVLSGPDITLTRDSLRSFLPELPKPGLVRIGALILIDLINDVSPEQPEPAEPSPEPA